jgi:hypothetical protein
MSPSARDALSDWSVKNGPNRPVAQWCRIHEQDRWCRVDGSYAASGSLDDRRQPQSVEADFQWL